MGHSSGRRPTTLVLRRRNMLRAVSPARQGQWSCRFIRATAQQARTKCSGSAQPMASTPDRPPAAVTPTHPPLRVVLRALRESRGVTQQGWAAWLGYSVATVRRWESGTAAPTAEAEEALLVYCEQNGLF